MPVPKKLKEQIRRAVNREYPRLSLARRRYIANAIIYHRLGYGRGRK
jgi:hypothetical protein